MHPRLQWLRARADLLPDTDLDGTAARIREGAAMTPESIWLVVASAMLASIGLDTDSVAVIIGAMLISPLMSPILGVGFGIATHDRALLTLALRELGLAMRRFVEGGMVMTMFPRLPRVAAICLLHLVPLQPASGQEEVVLDRVRDYVNRRVGVLGQVADVRRQPNGDVWLSLGSPYPKGPLVVVIPREMVPAHPDYATYLRRYVRVNGMVRPSAIDEEAVPEGMQPSRSRRQQTTPTKPSILLDNPQRLELVEIPPAEPGPGC